MIDKHCGNCWFKELKDASTSKCWDCRRNPVGGLESGYSTDRWVTDSNEFWKDKPVTNTLQAWVDEFCKPSYDTVEKPKHYMLFEDKGIEVRDVLEKLVEKLDQADTPEVPPGAMFFSDYVQCMQYLMRFMDKNGLEDLKKARWYLEKMIGAYP